MRSADQVSLPHQRLEQKRLEHEKQREIQKRAFEEQVSPIHPSFDARSPELFFSRFSLSRGRRCASEMGVD